MAILRSPFNQHFAGLCRSKMNHIILTTTGYAIELECQGVMMIREKLIRIDIYARKYTQLDV
jgi:hypothetical protein